MKKYKSKFTENSKPYKSLFENFDEEEVEEEGPQPEDIIVSDSGRLGSGYSVSIVEGKHIGNFDTAEEVNEAIGRYTSTHQFWPSVWYVNDHGNVSPWTED